MERSLTVRRRLNDGLDGIWLGYDEYLDGKPTGKIVMGWRYDTATRQTTYNYSEEPPENKSSRHFLNELGKIGEQLSPAQHDFIDEMTREADEEDWNTVPPVMLTPDATRFIISFDWHYGHEELVVPSLDDVNPTRKNIESKYSSFEFSNWSVRQELVFITEKEWPE